MDSLHLVDPQLRPLLDAWPMTRLNDETLAASRAREFPIPPFDRRGTLLERRSVPGPAGAPDVGLVIYRPEKPCGPLPAIFHIHGGGYVGGAADQMEFLHRPLVKALGCVLVSVDYRLAPEAPFPAAIEDCYAGLAWVIAHGWALGIDPARIGVMGESAGGGLAAALALMVRDRGGYALAFQHLIYPMLDDRTCVTADPHPHAGQFIWPPHNNHYGWGALLGHAPGIDGVSPYAAPARATDLSGLPPTYIATGALDLFVEEDMDYARRLLRAGVATELHVYPGAFHGFDMFPGAAVAAQAVRDSRDALARFLRAAG
ncbi:alpha/beta hydrolase [Sphingomonas naphthae]|uniref:Alpha/beta hydrolase n=1 Tax=Sphingomonas naphthae TaxID=1813468 RepID=A0ABY7THV3_9SPHN|nr:alpha/beta hydrolase [Sphingomonas naphthae]WCT72802.1 alpha/beta hydrolase [Sphingomonas naphthae]